MIRSRAPIRIDFAGGWTDVPPFSGEVGGAVVNAAINKYTYATCIPRDDEGITITSADLDTSVAVRSFREIEYDGNLDLVKAAIQRLNLQMGMHLMIRCDAPPGSGVGSSASVSVALIGLLNRLQKDKLSNHEVAQLARALEWEELHIAVGKQDQYAAALGGINYMQFADPAVHTSPLDLSSDTINELEKNLVLCYTGKSRLSGDIIGKVMGAYKRKHPQVTEALHNLKGIAEEMKSALLRGQLQRFAALMAANWENQKALDRSVSNPYIDQLFTIAYDSGALGGKALGAGGGGCLLFYCDGLAEHQVRKKLQEAGAQLIDFNFAPKGLQTWRIDDEAIVN